MGWISRILYFLLFVLAVNVFRSFLGRILKPGVRRRSGVGASRKPPAVSGHMVRDPQCGMYVASDLAVTARLRGKTFHFCSEDCRTSFVNSQSKS